MAKDRYVAYVGAYTRANNSIGIHVYDICEEKGQLIERSVVPIHNPSYLTVSSDGKFLYSIEDEGVAAFRIDENGDLERMNRSWIGGMRGCFVKADSKNRFLFVAGYHDGRVSMMKINEDGSIGDISDGIFHQGIGKSTAEKRLDPRVTCVRLTPDEKYLCAVDHGLNQIKMYEIDYERGKMILCDIVRFHLDSAPRRIKFSKDGKFAYVVAEQSNQIHVFSYQNTTKGPMFERVQKVFTTEEEDKMLCSCDISFTSDDEYLFVSMDGANSVTFFKRDKETGMLEYQGRTWISGDYPKTLAVLPGNQYFVSLNHDSNEIRSFAIDYDNKYCLMKNGPIKISKPNCIQIHKLS